MSTPITLLTIEYDGTNSLLKDQEGNIIGKVIDVSYQRDTIEVHDGTKPDWYRQLVPSREITITIKCSTTKVNELLKKAFIDFGDPNIQPPFVKGDVVNTVSDYSYSLFNKDRSCHSGQTWTVEDCYYSSIYRQWVIENSGDTHLASDFRLAE